MLGFLSDFLRKAIIGKDQTFQKINRERNCFPFFLRKFYLEIRISNRKKSPFQGDL
ncbi:hypothetical protein LEP1GSC133_0589 [Leptospira borgpetersenii serovar Pomona str. 200901868]|uniref:Uncharacterized protein n=1 Tax=Leptospira borgpetersenii serovar Pomona str. 200901868 TaxID=1192866 RepID=M6WF37_LEPBO|nr:hypothetical protein LEP1GSC133_0589 [Leptospira borgpetersenii serovar Pomona str. 200901868]